MDLRQLLVDGLRELAGMEKVLMVGLPGMVEAISDGELRKALAEHLTRTEKQAERIDEASWSMGLENPNLACKPMIAMVADAAKASCSAPAGTMRDVAMLGAVERTGHFEVAAYAAEIMMAKLLGYGDLAARLVENLEEEMKGVEQLKRVRTSLLERAQKEA